MIRKIWDVIMPVVIILVCMIVGSIAVLALSGVIFMVTPDMENVYGVFPDAELWTSIVSYGLTIAVIIPFFRIDTQRFGKFQNEWKPGQMALAAVAALAAAIVLNAVIALSAINEVFTAYQEAAETSFYGRSPVLLIIAIVILAPIAEETVFRGLVYRRIRSYLGVKGAVIISSLMFGIYHMNVIQFIYASCMGAIFAIYLEKSNSLKMPIIAHMVSNAFGIISFF